MNNEERPNGDTDKHIFISYARADAEFATRLAEALKANSFRVWFDADYLKPSQQFWKKIEAAIDEAAAFVSLISPISAVSVPCVREIQRALSNEQKIVPILIREVSWDGYSVSNAVQNVRSSLEFATFENPDDFESSLDLLVRTLRNEWEDAEVSASLSALALNWQNSGRSPGSTLNLDQIKRSVEWVAGGAGRKKLTDLQREFLYVSQKKAEEERKALEDALASSQAHEREALKRESLLLSELSRQKTAAGRADLGAKLALEALPRTLDSPGDRPLVAAAEMALYAAIIQSRFRLVIEGRQEKLGAAGISPSGERAFLSLDTIGGLQTELWDVTSGEILKAYIDANYFFEQATFSPDGRFFALGYVHGAGALLDYTSFQPLGNLIHIVDAKTGETVNKFSVPGQKSTYLQFSPSGRTLLVVTDQILVVLETESWQFGGIPDITDVTMACFSDDERKVVLLAKEKSCWLICLDTKEFQKVFEAENEITGLQLVGANGSRLIVATGSNVVWMDLHNDDEWGSLAMQDPAKVLALGQSRERAAVIAITEDGLAHSWEEDIERIEFDASGNGSAVALRSATLSMPGTSAIVELIDGSIEFWNLSNAKRINLLNAEDRTLIHAGFTSAGSLALLATSDNKARFWNCRDGHGIGHVLSAPGKTASSIGLICKEDKIAIGYEDGTVEIRALEDGALVWNQEAAHKDEILHVAFDGDGERLLTSSNDKTAAVWNLEAGHLGVRLSGHEQLVSFGCFSPDGTQVVTSSSDSTSRIWDLSTAKTVHELALPEKYRDPIHNASILHHAVFPSDGKRMITVSAGDGYNVAQPAFVWDVLTGELLYALKHEGAIWGVSLTPDDKYAVTCSYDRTVRMWDLTTGDQHRIFSGHRETVFIARVYSKGRLLASVSGDGTACIWSVNSGSVLHVLKEHDSPVIALAMSSDDRLLATGGNDGLVFLWDATLGNLAGKLPVLDAPLRDLIFTVDSRSLVTRSKAGTVQVWSLPPMGQSLIDLGWEWFGKDGEILTSGQRVRFNLAEPENATGGSI